jgi:HlyD family secretion protein
MRLRSVALLAVLATAACTAAPAPPPVVRVDRGPVVTTGAASGTLVGISRQNLGFAEGGELVEVPVKVGDRVAAGQVLARLENFDLQQELERAQAQLDSAQAQLDKVAGSNAVDAAEDNLEQAREVLAATEEQAGETDESNDTAVERAEVQLAFDREQLERAEDRLADAEDACPGGTSTASATPTPAPTPAPAAPQPSQTQQAPPPSSTATQPPPSQGNNAVVRPVSYTSPAPAQAATDCQQTVDTAEDAVEQARGTVIASETALATAEERRDVDEASGRVSVENARSSVVTAEGTLGSASADRPADTAVQEAAVREAQVGVDIAQRDLDETALRAPTAGVVSEINGAVGETVGAVSGATTLAPGSTARLPQLADTTGTGAGAATGGGGALIVLDGVDSFQLVVPFEESDATRVRPGSPASITVDAAADRVRPAQVLAVAPTATDVSGIVNYYATIVLTEGDPVLRDGQTAEASVEVDAVLDVLRVPSSVVRTEGGQRVVDVPGSEEPVPFTPGATGDEFTEVRSGLTQGQEVLLPQGQVTAVQGGGPPPAN